MQRHGPAPPTPCSRLCFLDQHFSDSFPTLFLSYCDICYICNTCSAQVGIWCWIAFKGWNNCDCTFKKISLKWNMEHLSTSRADWSVAWSMECADLTTKFHLLLNKPKIVNKSGFRMQSDSRNNVFSDVRRDFMPSNFLEDANKYAQLNISYTQIK